MPISGHGVPVDKEHAIGAFCYDCDITIVNRQEFLNMTKHFPMINTSVPGTGSPLSDRRAHAENFGKDMDAFWSATRAGERPDTTTRVGIEKYHKRIDSWEKAENLMEGDDVVMRSMKQSVLNTDE